MKKTTLLYLLPLLTLAACGGGGNKSGQNGSDTTKKDSMNTAANATVLTAVGQPAATAPYTIEVIDTKAAFAPTLQSFGFGQSGGQWLLVGGRTNGFHGTSDNESTFPTKFSNTNMFVVDPTSKKSWRLEIPAVFKLQLQSTNMNCYQDGDYLYCIGGYGSSCATDSPECYQTFPNLTAINVPNAIAAITSNNAQALEASITSITDERMRVTGGALRKIGGWFYLVMGQNYDKKYKGAVTGIYTQQVRKFQIGNTGGQLTINNYTAYDVPWSTPPLNDQFHRRDLTVSETIMDDGTHGITVYGGVFSTNGGNGFPNPIYISQDNTGNTAFAFDQGFAQKLNLYECANVTMYDPTAKNMYTSFLGGITDYYYDKAGVLTPGSIMNFLPFSKNATTVVRNGTSKTSVEYPQQSPALPGYIGSDAEFIPNPALATYGGMDEMIDYSQVPTGRTLVGWMYGGILSTAEQSSEMNPTFANSKIYEVWITK